jgi:hypothetical protein
VAKSINRTCTAHRYDISPLRLHKARIVPRNTNRSNPDIVPMTCSACFATNCCTAFPSRGPGTAHHRPDYQREIGTPCLFWLRPIGRASCICVHLRSEIACFLRRVRCAWWSAPKRGQYRQDRGGLSRRRSCAFAFNITDGAVVERLVDQATKRPSASALRDACIRAVVKAVSGRFAANDSDIQFSWSPTEHHACTRSTPSEGLQVVKARGHLLCASLHTGGPAGMLSQERWLAWSPVPVTNCPHTPGGAARQTAPPQTGEATWTSEARSPW